MRLADGKLDYKVLFITVPVDAHPGAQIRVKIGVNAWDLVRVPDHLKPGDVMRLDVASLPQKKPRGMTLSGELPQGDAESPRPQHTDCENEDELETNGGR